MSAYTKLKNDLEIGIQEAIADNPGLSEDEVALDLSVAIAGMHPSDAEARDFLTREWGYVPDSYMHFPVAG